MKKETKMKPFNLIVTGYGGQGILTLADIIAKAALKQRYDVKEAELHGLAQRSGSLECHIRFGKSIYSPLVTRGRADLIIALDASEALRACYWANKKTKVLTNSKIFRSSSKLKQVLSKIKKFTKNLHLVDADSIVKKETKDITMVNMFMLGYAIKKRLLPLKKKLVWQAIEERINKKFLKENKKIFEKAFKSR